MRPGSATTPAAVTPRRTSLRATLDLLAHDLAEAVLAAVRGASLTELAELLEPPADRSPRARPTATARVPAPRLHPGASSPARSARRSARALRPPRRGPMQQLELLPHVEAYADVAILDPAAVLGGPTSPQDDAPRVPIAPTTSIAPREHAAALSASRTDPVARPGEELLRATGGGVVLRRRRPPNRSVAPEGAG